MNSAIDEVFAPFRTDSSVDADQRTIEVAMTLDYVDFESPSQNDLKKYVDPRSAA